MSETPRMVYKTTGLPASDFSKARDTLRADEILKRLSNGDVVSIDDYEFVVMHEGEAALMEAIAEKDICLAVIMKFVCNSKVSAYRRHIDLQNRIAALEASGIKFCGTYVRGNQYSRGDVTVSDGAAWTALRKINVNEKPGEGDGWHLLAAKGRDGKDGKVR